MRAFLRARLARDHWLGLHVTLGVVVGLVALAAFAAIAAQVLAHGPLAALDAQLARRLHAGGNASLTRAMVVFAQIHGTAGVLAMVLLLGIYLARRGDRHWLVALVLAVPGAMLLNLGVKAVFQRPRPSFEPPLMALDSFSFPSGHVAAATALYGFIAVFCIAQARGWGARLAAPLVALGMIVLVALNRLVLGVHYFSDVLAAFAQSSAWLALCLAVVVSVSMRRRA